MFDDISDGKRSDGFMASANKKGRTSKKSLQSGTKIMIAVAVVVVIIAVVLLAGHSSSNKNASTTINSPSVLSSGGSGAAGPIKLSASQYAHYAYLIYPNNSGNRYAAAGFNVTIKNLNNGTVKVTIEKLGNTGTNANFTFPASYELYYIDQAIGDDASPSSDYVSSDDYIVIVNASGYIVGSPISP